MVSTLTDRLNGINGGVSQKAPVACATVANITLSGEQTIDGVSTSGSYVLVKEQSDSTENGIYISNTGSWSRRPDADGARDLVRGTEVYVTDGTVNGDTLWSLRAASDPIIVGTSSITFESFTNIITSGYLPVAITSPASGEIISYNGANWVNYNYKSSDITFSGSNVFSGSHTVSGGLSLPTKSELTISAGSITVTGSNHLIDTQGDASSDDVDTILGLTDGGIALFSAANASRSVVLKHGVGNISTATLTDVTISSTGKYVGIVYDEATAKNIVLFDGTTKEYVDNQIATVSSGTSGTVGAAGSVTDGGTGMITKWGVYGGASASATLTFPVAFPSNCFTVVVTCSNGNRVTVVTAKTASGFNFSTNVTTSGSASATSFYWIAIGN